MRNCIPCKLFHKYPGKSGCISTISNISSLFISRRKLHLVSYGLMGIVLSTYRYKNIYPRHLKIGFKFDKTKARKALYVSKMSMCIWTGGTVAVMCIAIYWDLCKGYMNIPFKIIAIVLILLLVGNMRRRSIYFLTAYYHRRILLIR